MQFSKIFVLLMTLITSGAYASDVKEIILSKEYGSCETRDLMFSAMKFYKIPLNEKYDETYDIYLRLILFFNADGTLTLRSTTQALIGCQTSSSGEELCSFKPLMDQWLKGEYTLLETINVPMIGSINLVNPENTNRGFNLKFKSKFTYPHLEGKEFPGGMVSVNFNQDGKNVINICK